MARIKRLYKLKKRQYLPDYRSDKGTTDVSRARLHASPLEMKGKKNFFKFEKNHYHIKNVIYFYIFLRMIKNENITCNIQHASVYVKSELKWNERPRTENYWAKTVKNLNCHDFI